VPAFYSVLLLFVKKSILGKDEKGESWSLLIFYSIIFSSRSTIKDIKKSYHIIYTPPCHLECIETRNINEMKLFL
jgi:hypothetical protein